MATKDIQGQNVMGKLFCFKWLKTGNLNENIPAVYKGRLRVAQNLQVHSSFQRKEKHRHEAHHFFFMRKFSLVTVSGKICPN